MGEGIWGQRVRQDLTLLVSICSYWYLNLSIFTINASYIIMFLVIFKIIKLLKMLPCHLISWHNINIIYFVCGTVDSSECRTQLIKLVQVSIWQIKHLKFLPLLIHQSPSLLSACPMTSLLFLSPSFIGAVFFLPFRIGMGHPWNCQASSCLISSVKFKLASDLHTYTYTTWLRICGISVNVRISETGKEISVCFESIYTHDEIRPPEMVLWESVYEQPSSSSHQGFHCAVIV